MEQFAATLVSAALGAVAGVVSAVAVRRSRTETVAHSTTTTITADLNDLLDRTNRLERQINRLADQNRELRAENRELRERVAAMEIWVRAQGHDPDLITLTQVVRDAHMDLDKEA